MKAASGGALSWKENIKLKLYNIISVPKTVEWPGPILDLLLF